MSLGEVAAIVPHDFLSEAAATTLSRDVQDGIGCLNSLRLRKT
jgi:hypothetical protein